MPVARTRRTSSFCWSITTKSSSPSLPMLILQHWFCFSSCKKYQFLKRRNFTGIYADCQYIKNLSMCWVQALHTLTSEKLVSSQTALCEEGAGCKYMSCMKQEKARAGLISAKAASEYSASSFFTPLAKSHKFLPSANESGGKLCTHQPWYKRRAVMRRPLGDVEFPD